MDEKENKRGVLLTIWLVLMLIANGLTAIAYLLGGSFIASALPDFPSWAIYVFGVLALLNFAFTIFLFKWKLWAFYAYCGSAALIFVLNIVAGTGIGSSLLGLLSPVILYLIMRPKWAMFQ